MTKKTDGLNNFIAEKSGVAAIEFAILFLPFMLLILSLLETMILIYQISSIDYALSKAARFASASLPTAGYETRFKASINESMPQVLGFLRPGDIQTSLEFCRSIDELVSGTCTGNNEQNKFIIYTITAKLQPMFKILRLGPSEDRLITKTVYYSERNEYNEKEKPKPKK
ncbi:TadE/TadG family type IV pilus assembly protein [Helicobacter sp. 11S02596-1]|uniref:TadE/TadG family type IV pilus assembly protein n=1 Tax=Helicobacter sp. 11S02596-1 TaxID=1476194 RepID=UPI000BA567F4|nr:TadE/TadG family type IV pilus assembly protein [Helicobacter sp. 11S02596-1]PAF43630.1 hypothetical protein BJI48_05080 [Helicobacter sp. 11S02596-1]